MNHKEEAIKRVEEFYVFRVYDYQAAKQCALLVINREIELLTDLSKYLLTFTKDERLNDFIEEMYLSDLTKVKKEIELL